MAKKTDERAKLLELLTDERTGSGTFSKIMKLQNAKEAELKSLVELLFLSLTSLSVTRLGSDSLITLLLTEKTQSCFYGIRNEKEIMQKIESISKIYDLSIPSLAQMYLSGYLGFTCSVADKPITIENVQELIRFIDFALIPHVLEQEQR